MEEKIKKISLRIIESMCTGCRSCEMVCSFHHENVFHYDYSYIQIRKNEKKEGFYKISACRQCLKPSCMEVCPVGAITQEDSVVTFHEDLCTGCGLCIDACPWSSPVIKINSNVAQICDLCGGDPLCVKFCNHGALEVRERIRKM